MKKRYDEIMEHIEVTEDMRLRILANLKTISSVKQPVKSKELYRKFLPFAACLLLLTGAFAATRLRSDATEHTRPTVQGAVNGISTFSSSEELSDCLGFDVFQLKELPFETKKITYTSYWNSMSEITYHGNRQSAVFRQSPGSEDNSGDYHSYAVTKELMVNSLRVTLKGDSQQQFHLGMWSDNGFTFSLTLSKEAPLEDWMNMISNISL